MAPLILGNPHIGEGSRKLLEGFCTGLTFLRGLGFRVLGFREHDEGLGFRVGPLCEWYVG